MAEFINTIDLLGDEAVAISIIGKTITELNDNILIKVGESTFYECKNLISVDVPNVSSIGRTAFRGCTALTKVTSKAESISEFAFYQNSLLNLLVLRSSRVCSLSNTNAFDLTPFASNGTGGTVYVPQALITEYQNATNWSTLYAAGKCNFVAIEGSEYE
jgi:hypothetical protein